ncbi:FG-GAP repeat domain-containing protein, partial [Mariniphaga sediminis]|uniref:FG-GAP repeat domain-containing protein n=1 Tax=Mariniphaga sediminis TaxID=1628158 RepID=UPI00356A0570
MKKIFLGIILLLSFLVDIPFSSIGKIVNTPSKLDPEGKGSILFRHSTFKDFSNGSVSNSGHNLFVSHDGEIRFVNWFDLNNDGYPEIVAVNDHNTYETTDGFIYYNTPGKGFRSLMPPAHKFVPGFQKLEWMRESLTRMDRLPSIGGGSTTVVDLNGDGTLEILFANFVHGWSNNHFPVSLYWGGENGFSDSDVSYLPSLTASGLAVGDLNGDARKDIVMANTGREAFSSLNAG